ncbi:DUF2142 domain-containing protein [Streptococcus dentiloxodontae]
MLKELFNTEDDKTGALICFFLFFSFIMCLITIAYKGPMSGLDESSHYARSIQLATGQLVVSNNGDMSQVGGYISKTQRQFLDRGVESFVNSTEGNVIDNEWQQRYSDIPFSKEGEFFAATNGVPYTPFSYLPYIVVAKISQTFSIKPVTEYLWMRIIGFLFYFGLITLAIRITPIGKITLGIVMVIPTTIVNLTSISADGYLLAIASLFTAYVFHIMQQILNKGKALTINDYLAIMILSILLVMGKIPIFVLMGLFLPIIFILYTQKKIPQVLFLSGTIVFCAILTLLWLAIVKDVNTGAFFGRNVDTFKQLSHIRSDILGYLSLLKDSIIHYRFIDFSIGYTDSLDITNIPENISIFGLIALLMAIFWKGNTTRLSIDNHKIFYYSFQTIKYAIAASFVILVFTILYLQFSLIGSPIIDGVQSRYFIPIYFLIFSINSRISLSKNWYMLLLAIISIIPSLSYLGIIFSQAV